MMDNAGTNSGLEGIRRVPIFHPRKLDFGVLVGSTLRLMFLKNLAPEFASRERKSSCSCEEFGGVMEIGGVMREEIVRVMM
jgi:hypothetical protein